MRLSCALGLLLAMAAPCLAQLDQAQLYSHPNLPPRDVLDRLNLKMAWSKYVPTESRRDGFVSIQLAPLWRGKEYRLHMLVQTRSGLIAALDAETGETLWRTHVGEPYRDIQPLGIGNVFIVAGRGAEIFGIRRDTGAVVWKSFISAPVSAGPLVGVSWFYVPYSATEVGYYQFQPGAPPRFIASYRGTDALTLPPSLTPKSLIFSSPAGSVSVLEKRQPRRDVRFATAGPLPDSPGVHEKDESIYIGSRDGTVYAFNLGTGEPPWRFVSGAPIGRSPFVNDDDVYATVMKRGVHRLLRKTMDGPALVNFLERHGLVTRAQLTLVSEDLTKLTDGASVLTLLERKGFLTSQQRQDVRWRGGESLWSYLEADRVLAVNPKFVYVTDFGGRLLVLERDRGLKLSRYDFSDFVVPVKNEITDRIYLAAHSGLIVCLHDRDYAAPQIMKQMPPPTPEDAEARAVAPAEPMPPVPPPPMPMPPKP